MLEEAQFGVTNSSTKEDLCMPWSLLKRFRVLGLGFRLAARAQVQGMFPKINSR